MVTEERVAQHYGSAGIAERILAALRAAQGVDAAVTPDALAPLDHFHGGGVIATREAYVRQMPGRLVGQTTDRNGKRGFVLTLATREQHIRREKATSNICTNQALVALMANIFMTIYGKVGLKELARQNLAKTVYAAQQFGKHATVLFGAPRFNEFVVRTSEDPHAINSRLLGHKIVGGFPLKKFCPELGNASLWCCTELTTRSMIDTAVGVVAASEASDTSAGDGASLEEVAK